MRYDCILYLSLRRFYRLSIDKLRHHIFVYTSSCRERELKTMLSSYFESRTIVKEIKLQNFCFQELQDDTGMDSARSSWKLLPIIVGLSPFLLMNLYLILHYYSCTATIFYCHFRNIEVESNDCRHLESLDVLGPGGRILKKCALAR